MKLVIVESPAKSKTIGKYLGKDYKILASFGHVRDLPSKDGSVEPENEFKMNYEIKTASKKTITEIINAAKEAEIVYMASDPDREGEAIAWNVVEILKQKKIKAEIKRSVFNEITETAVKNSIKEARDIDYNLVDAQQSRLSLDYLVGFNVSPVLWRKLPNSKSAGRVQSVALRLIVDREEEIRAFVPTQYYSIGFDAKTEKKETLSLRVTQFLKDKFSNKFPNKKEQADDIIKTLEDSKTVKVTDIDAKDAKRNPFAPFNTASLQQDASNKLGFSVDRTMKVAQKLYEGLDTGSGTAGLITYMRTDGTTLSADALSMIRGYIKDEFGEKYLAKSPRIYKTKTKNAQEAHEAIRPTNIKNTPEKVEKYLDKDQFALYSLIWKRALACQMVEAIFLRQSIDFVDKSGKVFSRANGNTLKFDGFLKVYQTKFTEDGDGDLLPDLKIGDELTIVQPIESKQHFTSPKARFTEASLVAEMENLGIGRPSTYAAIINILQEREYVYLEKKQFHPNAKGVVVTMFLKSFFTEYVEYKYTANLEDELDLVSDGKMSKLEFLNKFWKSFKQKTDEAMTAELENVSKSVTKLMDSYIFSGNFTNTKKCSHCESKNVEMKIGKFGVYIACKDCEKNSGIEKYIENRISESGEVTAPKSTDEAIGKDENGNDVFFKSGRFGPYFEVVRNGETKRASIPAGFDKTIESGLFLLSLPKKVGMLNDEEIKIGIGKFGPYVLYNKKYTSMPKDADIFNITEEYAIDIIKNPPKRSTNSSSTPREKKTKELGVHPKTKKSISVGKSKYGVYALYQRKFYTLDGVEEVENATLEAAIEAIDKK